MSGLATIRIDSAIIAIREADHHTVADTFAAVRMIAASFDNSILSGRHPGHRLSQILVFDRSAADRNDIHDCTSLPISIGITGSYLTAEDKKGSS
jgi:hypothetical protein